MAFYEVQASAAGGLPGTTPQSVLGQQPSPAVSQVTCHCCRLPQTYVRSRFHDDPSQECHIYCRQNHRQGPHSSRKRLAPGGCRPPSLRSWTLPRCSEAPGTTAATTVARPHSFYDDRPWCAETGRWVSKASVCMASQSMHRNVRARRTCGNVPLAEVCRGSSSRHNSHELTLRRGDIAGAAAACAARGAAVAAGQRGGSGGACLGAVGCDLRHRRVAALRAHRARPGGRRLRLGAGCCRAARGGERRRACGTPTSPCDAGEGCVCVRGPLPGLPCSVHYRGSCGMASKTMARLSYADPGTPARSLARRMHRPCC